MFEFKDLLYSNTGRRPMIFQLKATLLTIEGVQNGVTNGAAIIFQDAVNDGALVLVSVAEDLGDSDSQVYQCLFVALPRDAVDQVVVLDESEVTQERFQRLYGTFVHQLSKLYHVLWLVRDVGVEIGHPGQGQEV